MHDFADLDLTALTGWAAERGVSVVVLRCTDLCPVYHQTFDTYGRHRAHAAEAASRQLGAFFLSPAGFMHEGGLVGAQAREHLVVITTTGAWEVGRGTVDCVRFEDLRLHSTYGCACIAYGQDMPRHSEDACCSSNLICRHPRGRVRRYVKFVDMRNNTSTDTKLSCCSDFFLATPC